MSAVVERSYWPQRILVAPESVDDAMTKRIISRLPDAAVEYLSDDSDPLSEKNNKTLRDSERFSQGKRTLLLSRYRGSWLRTCPGTSDHVCCNLWIVNPGAGCPLDCSYCYLQSYLARNPTLRLYTNTQDLLGAISERVVAEPERLFRIGTGELIDSLVWDPLTDATTELVPFFARNENTVLELKTKTDNVANLVAMKDEHKGNTVVSWSVNARSVTQSEEHFTATLDQRMAAAAQVIDAGYRIGLHFDPLVYFDGWQDGYREAIRDIFKVIDPKRVAWISVSTLRYKKEMQTMMRERFPSSSLALGEQFLASDNKLRYFQPIRFKLERFVWDELKAVGAYLPVYMCMETAAAWREVSGGSPVAGSELVEIFSRRGKPLVKPQQTQI